MPLTLPAVSTEYVRVPVAADNAGVAVNPTGDAVAMAFLTSSSASPASGDWIAGSWETATVRGITTHYARCLLGPGGHALAAGTYTVWVKVTDAPEVPERSVGALIVT